jgi:protein-tyrosine-phosphatase
MEQLLFVGIHNSARSHMAEAFLQQMRSDEHEEKFQPTCEIHDGIKAYAGEFCDSICRQRTA